MTQQHYRLTLSEAIAHYEKGWITATALLYYFLKIRLAPGWKMTRLMQIGLGNPNFLTQFSCRYLKRKREFGVWKA
jgi:hypothetical protein